MIDYITFIGKYPGFQPVSIERFDLFLIDAISEISKNNWVDNRDRAIEMFLGHILTVSDTLTDSSNVDSFEVDDRGYKVSYKDPKSGAFTTWFGLEYNRMLEELITRNVAIASQNSITFHAVRTDSSGICW
jgi:Protein of unknown function (DUF4054)